MITFEDCIGVSGLTSAEVDAIAEHEHVPAIVALEMGCKLMCEPGGTTVVQRFILDDIAVARARGDSMHAAELRMTLGAFRKRCDCVAA